MRKVILISIVGAMALLWAGNAMAEEKEKAQERVQTQAEERVYGSQLMTPEERAEYGARMRSANTAEEREQIRKEHHARMQERAKARGISLPDEPGERGMGIGDGRGKGPAGVGQGQGGAGKRPRDAGKRKGNAGQGPGGGRAR